MLSMRSRSIPSYSSYVSLEIEMKVNVFPTFCCSKRIIPRPRKAFYRFVIVLQVVNDTTDWNTDKKQ